MKTWRINGTVIAQLSQKDIEAETEEEAINIFRRHAEVIYWDEDHIDINDVQQVGERLTK